MRSSENTFPVLASSILIAAMVLLLPPVAPAQTYNEAPILPPKVAAGEVRPVDERLPDPPSVLHAPEIGQYGGTLQVFSLGNSISNDLMRVGRYLLQFLADGQIDGDMALSYDFNSTGVTISLRPGMSWSDGTPFTADDITFQFDDIPREDGIRPHPDVTGVVKLDDYTVSLETDGPPSLLAAKMATWKGGKAAMFAPRNYLSQWHESYNPQATAKASEEGYETWEHALNGHRRSWWRKEDPESPTLDPWQTIEFTPQRKVMERNPYYWQIDADGNQLPYFDTVVSNVTQDQDTYLLKIITGEADLAYTHTDLEHYRTIKDNEAQGDYSTRLIETATEVGIALNLNHEDREIFRDVRFRRALSLAIDREDVNSEIYFGVATPRQSAPIPSSSYYKKEWAVAYAAFDPAKANALLDEIGITDRNDDGFRTGPNGIAVSINVVVPRSVRQIQDLAHRIHDYWQKIGIRVNIVPMDSASWSHSLQPTGGPPGHDAVAMMSIARDELAAFLDHAPTHSCFGSQMPMSIWRPCGDIFNWGYEWGKWIATEEAGIEPPTTIKELDAYSRDWAMTEFGSDEYHELAQKIYDVQAEHLWIIGVVGLLPNPFIAKNDIGNAFTEYPQGAQYKSFLGYFAAILYRSQNNEPN